MSMLDIAKVLKAPHGRGGQARADPPIAQLAGAPRRLARLRGDSRSLPELGKMKNATNEKARRVLGWAPRSNEEAIVATAESLMRLGLLQDNPKSTKGSGGGASAAMR